MTESNENEPRPLSPEELEIEEMMLASLEAQRGGTLGPLYYPSLEEIFQSRESTKSPSNPMKKDRPSAMRKSKGSGPPC